MSVENNSRLLKLTLRVFIVLDDSSSLGYDICDVIGSFLIDFLDPGMGLVLSDDNDDESSVPESLISPSEAEIDATHTGA